MNILIGIVVEVISSVAMAERPETLLTDVAQTWLRQDS